ncbi:MAG: DUF6879 family protein [Dehalococcoidia bacterium]
MTSPVPPFEELIANTVRSAVHLEMRDMYEPNDPVYLDWQTWRQDHPGAPVRDWYPADQFSDWYDLVKETVARGVRMRRARIVSEPVTDYIKFEHAISGKMNVPAGEEVRWLPRRRASDVALPANDFWVFDDRLVRLHHFSGEGDLVEDEVSDDPSVLKLCVSAFEAVWERADPHDEYQIR